MTIKRGRVVAVILSLLLLAFSGFAQEGAKKKRKSASLGGTTGLFKTWDAETLRKGEINLSFGYDHFNRDPGQLSIANVPAALAIGITDRLEFFESMDVQRHIKAGYISTYRVKPGQLPMRSTTRTGVISFSQVAPFIDVPEATGRSDTHIGLKYNLLSERLGNSFSMALAGFGTFPGQRSVTGLNRGLSNGAFSGGYAFLFSKTAGEVGRLHLNIGTNFVTDPYIGDVKLANLQHEFIFKGGGEFPAYGKARFIAELSGIKYYGPGDTRLAYGAGINPRSAIDVILGIRAYPTEWMSVGAGYQASFNRVTKNWGLGLLPNHVNGAVVQAAFGTRRNDPPSVTCAVAKPSILQGDATVVRANAVDPDRDALTCSWAATGGKLSGSGDTATFDATGVAPGKYTVTVTVSDGKHQASCSSEITVLKRNHAPTVTCEPATTTLTQGESATLRANASDPDNDPLTYTWSVDGQRLAAAGPQITFGSEGRKPGTYKVTVTVSDGEESASCSMSVTVREKIIPNRPPVIECLTTTMDVASGSSIGLRARASDPDGDPLTISWTASGGAVAGSGESVTFNAAGVKAGSYNVTATADDGRGGKASCTMTVNVSERLSVTREKCGYFMPGKTRVDNCAKAILDDLAVRMKNEPRLRANIIGYTDSSRLETSKRAKALGENRAKAVASYLESKGVEASRLTITNGGANNPVGDNKTPAGKKLNRRVEIELTVR